MLFSENRRSTLLIVSFPRKERGQNCVNKKNHGKRRSQLASNLFHLPSTLESSVIDWNLATMHPNIQSFYLLTTHKLKPRYIIYIYSPTSASIWYLRINNSLPSLLCFSFQIYYNLIFCLIYIYIYNQFLKKLKLIK
jgi:hypothetical protein